MRKGRKRSAVILKNTRLFQKKCNQPVLLARRLIRIRSRAHVYSIVGTYIYICVYIYILVHLAGVAGRSRASEASFARSWTATDELESSIIQLAGRSIIPLPFAPSLRTALERVAACLQAWSSSILPAWPGGGAFYPLDARGVRVINPFQRSHLRRNINCPASSSSWRFFISLRS